MKSASHRQDGGWRSEVGGEGPRAARTGPTLRRASARVTFLLLWNQVPQTQRSKTTQRYICAWDGSAAQASPSEAVGKDTAPHSCRGGQSATPCRFTAEDQSPWGCQPAALVPRQSTPRHLQAHSCLQSLTELTGFHSINSRWSWSDTSARGRCWARAGRLWGPL